MKEWIEQEFSTARLGDKRLDKRMKLIMERLIESPKPNIKSAFKGWTEVMAAYRFFNNSKTSIEKILEPHRDATLLRVKEHQRVLIVQDTSELDYTLKKKLEGTGPLSIVERQGFFAHNYLVVTPERLPSESGIRISTPAMKRNMARLKNVSRSLLRKRKAIDGCKVTAKHACWPKPRLIRKS